MINAKGRELEGSHWMKKGLQESSSDLREAGQKCPVVTEERRTFSDFLGDLQGKARAGSSGGGKSNQS